MAKLGHFGHVLGTVYSLVLWTAYKTFYPYSLGILIQKSERL